MYAELGEAFDHFAFCFCLRAGGGTDQRSFFHALQDRCQAEETKNEVEIPVFNGAAAGSLAVTVDIFLVAGDAVV